MQLYGNKLGSFTSKSINGIRFVNAVTQVNYGRDNTKAYVNYLTDEDVITSLDGFSDETKEEL